MVTRSGVTYIGVEPERLGGELAEEAGAPLWPMEEAAVVPCVVDEGAEDGIALPTLLPDEEGATWPLDVGAPGMLTTRLSDEEGATWLVDAEAVPLRAGAED